MHKQGGFIQYRLDPTYEFNLENWYSQMDMMCTPESTINLLVSMYFLMLAVGGILFFPVTDRIGRRKTHYVFSTLNLFG